MLNDTLLQEWMLSCGNDLDCLNFIKNLKNMNASAILHALNSSFDEKDATELETFHRCFAEFHGIGGLAVCIIGVIVSALTLTILCRQKLRTSTNMMLSVMAVSDMLTMLFYIPVLLTMYLLDDGPFDMNADLIWKTYYLFSIMTIATCHTYSVWVGVALAIIRLFQVRKAERYPTIQSKWMKFAKVSIMVCFFITTLSLSPFYYTIYHHASSDTPETLDLTQESSYIPVLTYAILSKIIPSILMAISGSYIIVKTTFGQAKRRRENLRKGQKRGLATTNILLLLISLFVITELPQGIIMILGICWPEYFSDIFHYSGDLQDFVTMVITSINFILYCTMSKRFRSEFIKVYVTCISR